MNGLSAITPDSPVNPASTQHQRRAGPKQTRPSARTRRLLPVGRRAGRTKCCRTVRPSRGPAAGGPSEGRKLLPLGAVAGDSMSCSSPAQAGTVTVTQAGGLVKLSSVRGTGDTARYGRPGRGPGDSADPATGRRRHSGPGPDPGTGPGRGPPGRRPGPALAGTRRPWHGPESP